MFLLKSSSDYSSERHHNILVYGVIPVCHTSSNITDDVLEKSWKTI